MKLLLFIPFSLFSFALIAEELRVPTGFVIEIFAKNVVNARQMALGEQGTVFVGSRRVGKVIALLDSNNDGKADKQFIIDSDLNMPSGLAYKDGALYVAAVNRILRYDNIESQLSSPPEPVVVIDSLPDDEHHGWKALAFSPDGYLYIPVGVPCNVCISDDERHGSILKLDVAKRTYNIVARGVRNSVGLAFHPVDNSLWFTDNGRDSLGDNSPPDEINHLLKPGLNFGFPFLHGKDTLDPVYGDQASVDKYTLPVVELDAHVAPLGLAFYTSKQYPDKYHNSLFVAEHGSWNRSKKIGYRVIHVQLNAKNVTIEPFITGWLNKKNDTAWGRPVDILNLADGSLLVSDDYADVIYRVSYSGVANK